MKKQDEEMTTKTPTYETEQELQFAEQLELLSNSIGRINIGENSNQICRVVRGKE
ncbi:hypothetical protein [Falsibacillus albus]|uniref:hypothetical protein n=1 Tax=Falsibacillus albus TaxID=2478915 RepID=UPI001314F2D5|nr:hypothetical protein [Falsibacillus albus]